MKNVAPPASTSPTHLAAAAMNAIHDQKRQQKIMRYASRPAFLPDDFKLLIEQALERPAVADILRQLIAEDAEDHARQYHDDWRQGAWGELCALDKAWAEGFVRSGKLTWADFGAAPWIQDSARVWGFEWQEPNTLPLAVATLLLNAFVGSTQSKSGKSDGFLAKQLLTYVKLHGKSPEVAEAFEDGLSECVNLVDMVSWGCDRHLIGARGRVEKQLHALGLSASSEDFKALIELCGRGEDDVRLARELKAPSAMIQTALVHDHVAGMACLLDGLGEKTGQSLLRRRFESESGRGSELRTLVWHAVARGAFDCAQELLKRKALLGYACHDGQPIAPCNVFIELSRHLAGEGAAGARDLVSPLSVAAAEELIDEGWTRVESAQIVEALFSQAFDRVEEDGGAAPLRAAIESSMMAQTLALAQWARSEPPATATAKKAASRL